MMPTPACPPDMPAVNECEAALAAADGSKPPEFSLPSKNVELKCVGEWFFGVPELRPSFLEKVRDRLVFFSGSPAEKSGEAKFSAYSGLPVEPS